MTLPESEECSSECPPPKRVKLEETVREDSTSQVGLLNCCDDLMLEIFSYLKPKDLLALSQCCQRIKEIVFDRTLWISVDFRPNRLSYLEIEKYIKFLLPSTNLIATIGPWIPKRQSPIDAEVEYVRNHVRNRVDSYCGTPEAELQNNTSDQGSSTLEIVPSFTGGLLEKIKEAAPNLVTLILENHILDAEEFSWEQFPPGLEYLSLRQSHILNIHSIGNPSQSSGRSPRSFFYGIDKHLPRLKVLDLSECMWFESHSFLALSKCKALEELRLSDNCIKDFVPYISLGTRFGFKALTVVDFRRTWVSDREISCLNKTPTLKELYLEAPPSELGRTLITDMAITSFGATLEAWNAMGFFVVLMAHNEGFQPSPLRVIELCNYVSVTDTSLRHCASCLTGLKLLNIKGTNCTEKGVISFKSQRPEVEIVSDFDLEVGTSGDNT